MFQRILLTTSEEYVIIDDSFTHICKGYSNFISMVDKIINVYEERKMNAGKNIVLFFIFYSRTYKWSIKEQYNLFIKYCKDSNKYKDDIS